MMRRPFTLGLIVLATAGVLVLAGWGGSPSAQSGSEQLAAAELNTMIQGLGYETKSLNSTPGKEKFEFTVTRSNLDIPIAAEISASKNYVWMTVFLKDNVTETQLSAATLYALLKRNAKVQPSQFYVTDSNKLMCAMAIDNRGITAAVLRRVVDKLAADVADSQDLWSK